MGLWSGVPDRLLGGICAHATCDRAQAAWLNPRCLETVLSLFGQVQAQIYPVYLARALHLKFALPSTAEHLKALDSLP